MLNYKCGVAMHNLSHLKILKEKKGYYTHNETLELYEKAKLLYDNKQYEECYLMIFDCFWDYNISIFDKSRYGKLRSFVDKYRLSNKILKKFHDEADNGNAHVQFALGYMYYDKDNNKSIEYFRKSAAQNHPASLYRYYQHGTDVSIDVLIKSAELECVSAQYHLGEQYLDEENYDYAIKLLIKAVDKGHLDSIQLLGEIYHERIENQKAVDIYHKGAMLGCKICQYKLGEILTGTEGMLLKKDFIRGGYWYLKSKRQHKIEVRIRYLSCYCNSYYWSNDSKVIKWLIEKDDIESYQVLGYIYISREEYKKAYDIFKKGGELDCGICQYKLGEMLKEGRYIEANDKEVVFWLQKSADNGCKEAILTLGRFYDNKKDDKKAVYLYSKLYPFASYEPKDEYIYLLNNKKYSVKEYMQLDEKYTILKMEKIIRKTVDITHVIVDIIISYAIDTFVIIDYDFT
jgi:TPR repeat protein